MISFSEYMQQYLKERGISYTMAAKMCQMDRTTISRYAKGERMVPTEEVLLKLENGLSMEAEEREGFKEAYKRTKLIEEYHVDYHILEKIVNKKKSRVIGHGVNSNNESGQKWISEEENTSIQLTGEAEILSALHFIRREAEYMKLYFSPCHFMKKEQFASVFLNREGIKSCEQIVEFPYAKERMAKEKLLTLYGLLPYLLEKEPARIYYRCRHFDTEKDTDNREYYLLTDRGIVFFNGTLTKGFFSNEKIPCMYYQGMFEQAKAQCLEFAEGGEHVYDAFREEHCEKRWQNESLQILFCGQDAGGCIWMIQKEEKQAVCISEMSCMEILKKFIWADT